MSLESSDGREEGFDLVIQEVYPGDALAGGDLTATDPGDGDDYDDNPLPDDPPLVPVVTREPDSVVDAERGREDLRPADGHSRVILGSTAADRRVRLRRLKEPTEGDTGEYTRPRAGGVIAALKGGQTLTYTLRRREAGGPIEIIIPHTLRPPESDVEPIAGSDDDTALQPTDEPRGNEIWVRFQRDDMAPADEHTGANPPDSSEQVSVLDVKDLLEGHDGPFELEIRATGISPTSPEYRELHRTARNEAHNASIYDGQDLEQSVTEARLRQVAAAAGTALANVTVAVTAPVEDLPRVARLVEGALPTSPESSWAAERMGQDLVGYTGKDAARSAGGSLIEAGTYCDTLVTYPGVETAGLQRTRRQNLSVEQDLPADVRRRSFSIGQRLDNLFDSRGLRRVAGELLMPLRDLVRHVVLFGASGSGKTEFLRQLIAGAKADNVRRIQEGEPIQRIKFIGIDFKKGGPDASFGQSLANRQASFGLLGEDATVTTIRPGEGGLRPILDICNPKNSTPSEQAERILHSVLIGVSSGTGSGLSGADGETQRVLERYVKDGIVAAYAELGWDMDTDTHDYPNGTPAHPTMAFIAQKIIDAIQDMKYEDKVKLNLETFNAGQFTNLIKLIPGRIFKDGHPIDFEKVFDSPDTTTFEFDKLGNNDTARKVAAVAIIQEIEKVVDARRKAMGIEGDVQEPMVVIALDEAGAIFDMTPAGQTTSEFLTRLRSKGIAIIISQQLIDGMNPVAFRNVGTAIGMRSNEVEVAARLKVFGDVTEDQLAYLNSREVKTEYGLGLAAISGVEGTVRMRSTRIGELPDGRGRVEDARRLVDVGSYGRTFTGETIARAGKWLDTEEPGMLVTAWAELSVALLLTGREPPKLNDRGALWSELTSMRLPPDAAKRDAAIIEAVCKAVDARPECMYAASPDAPATMKRYLIDQMLTQARGGRVGNIDVRLDLALPHGYYSRVLDVVEHAMIPGRLESSERFERFFSEVVCDVIGSKKQTIKIVGRDAAEQKSNLEKLERESLAAIHSAVTAATKGSATREDLRLARLALARLVGRPDDENGVALVREKLKLGGEEVTAFEQLRASMPTEELIRVGAQNFSILAMHEEINQAKRTLHETAKAVDLSSWSRREYRGEDFTVKSGLAKDQLALLRERQQRKIEESRYGKRVEEVDLFFATSLRNGGLELDNVVARLAERQLPRGKLHQRARRVLSDGQPQSLTIVDLARAMRVDDWARVVGAKIIYGENPVFRCTTGTKRKIVGTINQHVKALRTDAQIARKRRQGAKAG